MDISQKISEKNLLGFGSNRIVFDIGDGKVLKVPYNNIGLDSNKLEYEYYLKKPNIVAKIYSYENNFTNHNKTEYPKISPQTQKNRDNDRNFILNFHFQVHFLIYLVSKIHQILLVKYL